MEYIYNEKNNNRRNKNANKEHYGLIEKVVVLGICRILNLIKHNKMCFKCLISKQKIIKENEQ